MGTAIILFGLFLTALFIAGTPDKMNALWAALFILANVANAVLFFLW